jgi:hypothetical protein
LHIKQNAAEQSVHLTGGILRNFRAFSTPEQNPALEVLSTPAHPQVTQTVGQLIELKFESCKISMMNTDEKRTLRGEFYKAANGHVVYSIVNSAPKILPEIGNILVSQFGCTKLDSPIAGLDAVITKCQKGNIELDLGWDNWSDFYILSVSSEGDELVKEIGTYLNTIISGKDFEKYIYYW